MPAMANSYQPAQSHESKRMLHDLIMDPSQYEFWFERYAGGLIFRIGYGMVIKTGKESYVRRALEVVHTVERVASPGAYIVDTIPALGFLPEFMAPFKKEGRLLHTLELDLFRSLLGEVRERMAKGTCPPCFMKTFLEDQESFQLSDDEGAYVIGTLFEAGSGTTASAMMSYVLAMTHHSEWQEIMAEELDRVVGDRMPEFDDIPQLPTIRAVIKEVLRWRPVTAGGVPHQLIKDDIYEGYFFPAGVNVHANQWAIHREQELYPDPETFNPYRWLKPEFPTFKEPLTKFPSLQNYSAFGFGRRICPGMNIAERSLYILTARLAWACKISKKKDAQGNEIPVPQYNYTEGFNVQPKPFDFSLVARSEKRARAVREAWEFAEKEDLLSLNA
ncbi:hypothetical protein BP6252_10001 [Coleophoma cylindrospora]|uniref:Cytochrome P450 n=1 Tax=Coleophoma cylindrospora TaxID=1849047 RepID=A0A3D8QX45_9HELO|nr:hypothetical protein BP6252_10001 [Coleophoma cylindrospora]